MSQLQFFPSLPPPPRWEGGGYNNESSGKYLETITNQHIQLIEGNNQNNIIFPPLPPPPPPPPSPDSPPRIQKYDIPPPPPPLHAHQYQPIQTNHHHNNSNDNNLSEPYSPDGVRVRVRVFNTPESQPSHSSFNITKGKEKGETDDGIDSNIIDMDVDNIDLNDIDDKDYEFNEYEHANDDIVTKYNKRINMVFGERLFRSLYMNITLFLFCIFSFPLWFGDMSSTKNKQITNAYVLAAFSIFVTFLACICSIIIAICGVFRMQFPFQKITKNVVITMYFVGGFFYFVAACQCAHFYDERGLRGFGAIWFAEMFYVSVVIIISGIDFWKPFLNRMDHRIYTFFILYIFCSIILMFSYLICSDEAQSGFIAIGVSYLFGFVVCVMFLLLSIISNILTEEFVIKPKLDLFKPKLDVILSVLLCIFMLFLVIAYWATQRISEAEKVYYVGFGIFVFAINVLMTFDMKFSLYIARLIANDGDDNDGDDDDE